MTVVKKNNCQLILILILIPILNPSLALTDPSLSGVGTIELSFCLIYLFIYTFCFLFSDNYKNRHTMRVLGLHTRFKFTPPLSQRGGNEGIFLVRVGSA